MDDISVYIDSLVQWCDQNYLELNVCNCKTKEMLIDFRPPPYCVVSKELRSSEWRHTSI